MDPRESLRLITAPTDEPIAYEEAKVHLRLDDDYEAPFVERLIQTAREWCEAYQRRAYLTQTWRLTLDQFPARGACIGLSPSPVASVSSITYVDTAGVTQTLAPTNYTVDIDSEPARIAPAYGVNWPDTRAQIGAVKVTYVCGAATAATVSASVRQAMCLLVGYWFEHREAAASGKVDEQVAFGVRNLLAMDRVSF